MKRPLPTLDSIQLDSHRRIHVLRDDLLRGGTKERAVHPYLKQAMRDKYGEFVYASPFCGFAQVALAAAACDLGAKCRLFCVADAMQRPRFVEHEFTSLARACGAQVTLAGDLAEAQAQAELFAAGERTRYLVPLGFADEHFKRLMAEEIAWVWQCVCRELGGPPGRVWLPVGSGTLADCFRAVQPADVELLCVNVHVLDEGDARLKALSDRPGLRLIDAEEVFSRPALTLPPIPSNIHYDAKLWRFIEQQGRDGDLWWNVAR